MANAKRIIELVCASDGSIHGAVDDGRSNKEGDPAPMRQVLEARLKKTMTVDGKTVKMFSLNKIPDVSDEPWDSEWLKDRAGEWILPSKEWLALSAKAQKKIEARNADLKEAAPNAVKQIVASGDAAAVAGKAR